MYLTTISNIFPNYQYDYITEAINIKTHSPIRKKSYFSTMEAVTLSKNDYLIYICRDKTNAGYNIYLHIKSNKFVSIVR